MSTRLRGSSVRHEAFCFRRRGPRRLLELPLSISNKSQLLRKIRSSVAIWSFYERNSSLLSVTVLTSRISSLYLKVAVNRLFAFEHCKVFAIFIVAARKPTLITPTFAFFHEVRYLLHCSLQRCLTIINNSIWVKLLFCVIYVGLIHFAVALYTLFLIPAFESAK